MRYVGGELGQQAVGGVQLGVSAAESTTAMTASKPLPATLYAYRSPGPSAGSSCAGKARRVRIAYPGSSTASTGERVVVE